MVASILTTIPSTISLWIAISIDSERAQSLPILNKLIFLIPVMITLVFFLVVVSVFLFARPKRIICPHHRDEDGWIAEWREARRARG